MDTSSGLSSIASLSLGFTMSMRAGGMAFAANRGGAWAPGLAGAWWAQGLAGALPAKPPDNPATGESSTGSAGTSPRQDSANTAGETDSSRPAIESCRSLVVPCVSLVTVPFASKDRPLDVDSQLQPSDPPPCRPISPIVEVQEEADSSSTDDEHELTITTTSNTDWSPSTIDIPTVVEFQTIPEGPILQLPTPLRTEISPENVVANDETVIDTDDTLRNVSTGGGQNSGQSAVGGELNSGGQSADVVDKLKSRRPSLSHIGRGMAQCERENVDTVDSLSMPLSDREMNSSEQVSDDVIVAMDNDANGDVVGSFFTPSIVDSFAVAASPPPRTFEPLSGLVRCADAPERQVPDTGTSAVVADGAYKRLEGIATTSPLLNNGADSSAVGWTQTNRTGLAASPRTESSASASATSVWRKNPLTRLVRHRKDIVCHS